MTRYFMHLRDGTSELLDPDGVEFETMAALRTAVMATIRDLMCGDIRNGLIDLRFRIDAENEAGSIVYSLAFDDAINIIPQVPAEPA